MSAETEKRDWKEKAGRWLTRKREWMKVVYAVLKVHHLLINGYRGLVQW